MQNIKRTR